MRIKIIDVTKNNCLKYYKKKYNISYDINYLTQLACEITNIDPTNLEDVKSKALITSTNNNIFKKGNSLFFLLDVIKLSESKNDNFVTKSIYSRFSNYKESDQQKYNFAGLQYSLKNPLIMGIINVTPDSFSDGGKYNKLDKAIKKSEEFLKLGVDIIDVGGESTRPGSLPVDSEEEIERVVPLIENISRNYPDAVISIDTNKSKVADEAIRAGAKIINDISAATFDHNILNVAKYHNASIILMHIKGKPENMQHKPEYDDMISDIYDFLEERVKVAEKAGIKEIVIDPGIGFGKTVKDNFEIINKLDIFKSIGKPILIGLSRKSFLGKSLDLDINSRDNSTIISETISMINGAGIIRTHNVHKAIELKKLYSFFNNPDLLKDV